ncbi:MAG TPA: hypothetical protein VL101_15710 [Nordella sp.]|nr:hypothetical protein [Nordella sp.]
MTPSTQIGCACGQVRIAVENPPIISTECHCNSCRAAGARLRMLAATPPFLQSNGGTGFVLYRKDRVRFLTGADRLKDFHLTAEATTRRAVAGCCNTPVFLEFKNGHWLSLYSCLWPEGALPAPELRTMTSDLPGDVSLGPDVPSGKRQTLRFYAKLLGVWIAMGFQAPQVPVNARINA